MFIYSLCTIKSANGNIKIQKKNSIYYVLNYIQIYIFIEEVANKLETQLMVNHHYLLWTTAIPEISQLRCRPFENEKALSLLYPFGNTKK